MNNKQLNENLPLFNDDIWEEVQDMIEEHAIIEGRYVPSHAEPATIENIQDVLECFDFVAECINNID